MKNYRLYHFTFTSGLNPYIAIGGRERERVVNEYASQGCKVTTYHNNFILIDDRKINGIDPLWDCMELAF